MTDRIERLEAQVNALAQGWLRLAAALEVQGLVSPEGIEQALLSVRWPGQPIEAEATRTLAWLTDQLAEARSARRSAASQAPEGWYGTAVR
ncbi:MULTISPECIES: hypothetical protein [Pseudomonas]|uniref:hypothetical protein n=1 Tax=Pseudomonas TaxID=286 RepID=UPI0005A972E6|nr:MULTISPECIES: hypothetical protein [Pseudomonas]KAB0531350.1 hypothetical protein F7R16_16180 [Pseudomonas chlororaphis subsp. aureofaciens]TSD32326.1 hypothetical protein FCE86_023035 [Pseudomonas sp. ATCC 13985]WDG62900.1 hypothetical protein PUP52_13465 [Pseudomonas chlororaphis]WDG69167.1 hypothetical protein PUP59_13765 [Pseudomonas chlororaphis]